jgi:hypothetical protein
LRFPGAAVAGEFVHEHDRRAGADFLVVKASRGRRVVSTGIEKSPGFRKDPPRDETPASRVITAPLV